MLISDVFSYLRKTRVKTHSVSACAFFFQGNVRIMVAHVSPHSILTCLSSYLAIE
jgi:hypothetical protein